MYKKNKLQEITRIYCLVGVSIFISVYLLLDNVYSNCKYLFLLPLSYGFLNTIFFSLFKKKGWNNFAVFLLHGLMFLRMCISPLLLSTWGYDLTSSHIEENIPMAVFITIYEMLCIYITAYIAIKKNSAIHKKCLINNRFIIKCKMVIIFSIFLLLSCLALAPAAIKLYRTIFGILEFEFTGFDSRNVVSQYATSIITKFGIVTFRYVLNIIRILFPCIILLILKQNKKTMKYVISCLIALIFIFNFLIMDDTLAYSVCNTLIILLFYVKLYNKPRFFRMSIIIAGILVVLFFSIRLILSAKVGYHQDIMGYISGMLQAYFSGIVNIAAGLNIPNVDLNEKIKLFIYEILRGIPYASTIFGLDNTSMGALFNESNGSIGQIVPILSSSYYYFGFIFAPLLSCLFTFLGIRAGINIDTQENPIKRLSSIIVALYAILGFNMYSFEITSVAMFCLAIPIYLVGIFVDYNSHVSQKTRKRYRKVDEVYEK